MATRMMPIPPPALDVAVVEAARAGRAAETRAVTAEVAALHAPVVALLAARAERTLGDPARALALLQQAIPAAGELAPALRLEAAAAALALRQDPGGLLAPLLQPSAPPPARRAAARLLQASFDALPTSVLQGLRQRTMPRPLRRELTVVLAERGNDAVAAARVLRSRFGDQAALRAARWLATQPSLSTATRVLVAEGLLTGGAWSEAQSLLDGIAPPDDGAVRTRWAFLRGRAAYRLGDLVLAASAFSQAASLAQGPAARFEVGVQQARVAELRGDLADARVFWDAARVAQPLEVEGWDGSARVRALTDDVETAVRLLRGAPPTVQRVAGPRLAAVFVAHGQISAARRVLAGLPERLPAVRAAWLVVHLRAGESDRAHAAAVALLTDPHAGGWQELVLDAVCAGESESSVPAPTRDARELAEIALRAGAPLARAALADALAGDPAWAPLLSGTPSAPHAWGGPAAELVAAGLEAEAATLFPHRFPATTPAELAWSARRLAALGNLNAALGAGEALWARLGGIPAGLLPDTLLGVIVPPELAAGCQSAAGLHGVSAAWLFALVRQESRFDTGSFSSAGAIGMAQLVPEVVRRLGATVGDARDGGRALDLAARELARLTARFGPDLATVAAAYNAGETVTESWRHTLGDSVPALMFVAAIPYGETAGYVLAVREGVALAHHLK
jgi:soluble lytic murein transglycosylase-like protein